MKLLFISPRQRRNLRLTETMKKSLLALNFETRPIELPRIYLKTSSALSTPLTNTVIR